MTEEKNSKSKTRKQEYNNSQDDYMFMREVIKPARKKSGIFKKILGILVSGVCIGLIASAVFAYMLPYIQSYAESQEKVPKVELPDDYEHSQGNSASDINGESQNLEHNGSENANGSHGSSEVAPTGSPERLNLEGFRQVHEEIMAVAENFEKTMVVVQGINSEVDWMNNAYENKLQVSGVIVAENKIYYYVLTEYRAVENAERIIITFANQNTAVAEFVKYDPGTGLAIVKIAKKEMSNSIQNAVAVANLGNSRNVKRGKTVIAVGSPAGYSGSIAYGMITSTTNIITAIDTQYHLLTTDILGDHEGSGVLISVDGEVVGVIRQSFSMTKNQNILTAIPISEVKQLIEKLINDEDLIYLGVLGQDITAELSKNTGIPQGVYVNSVEKDSPAMEAGIQNGDVIVGVNDATIGTLQQLMSALNLYDNGEKITVNVMRKGADNYVQIVFDVVLRAL